MTALLSASTDLTTTTAASYPVLSQAVQAAVTHWVSATKCSGATSDTLYVSNLWGTDTWHEECDFKSPPPSLTLDIEDDLVIIPGLRARAFKLPDGGILRLDALGNYRLDDSQAHVIYQGSRIHAFNPYVNASDVLARFIEYLGPLRVRRHEVGKLPLSLFVNWLIMAAAEADGDPVPAAVIPITRKLLPGRIGPKCPACGHFVLRQLGYAYCNPTCAARHYERLTKATHETKATDSGRVPRRRVRSGPAPVCDLQLIGPGRAPPVGAQAVA